MNLRDVGCEAGRWMEVDRKRVQWWDLVIAILYLWVLLLYC